MKKLLYTFLLILTIVVVSCDGVKREPGSTYMPDMAYSRAYESYPNLDSTIFTESETRAGSRIFYDRKPVAGTVKRGQVGVYHYANDSMGRVMANAINNPLDSSITAGEKEEAVRLFNIYCAICHGTDMKGQGPIVANGKYTAAAANLTDVAKFGKAIYGDGQLFHSITYGKNQMGGYASQLNNKQRWMIVNYIRSKQLPAKAVDAKTDTKSTAATTSTTKTVDTIKAVKAAATPTSKTK